jgi:hypothetical protein
MSSTEHPTTLNSEVHHAFSERVAWHTAVVINGVLIESRSANGQIISSEAMGIGSACSWKGKKLLLTAKHVVDGAVPRDLRFFLRQDRPIDWNTRPFPPTGEEATVLGIQEIVRCSSEDLACIILEESESGNRLEFANLPQDFGDVPPDGSGTLIFGSPADRCVCIGEFQQLNGQRRRDLAVEPRGCWVVVAGEPPMFFPSSFDSDRHFLLRYDPDEEGSLPFGFSGAGVWYRRQRNDSIWVADPVLAGVQVGWHRESKLMTAIRSSVVKEFLDTEVS